jgi:hypothetical protein
MIADCLCNGIASRAAVKELFEVETAPRKEAVGKSRPRLADERKGPA